MGESKYEFVSGYGHRYEAHHDGHDVCLQWEFNDAASQREVLFARSDAPRICRIISQAAGVEYASPDGIAQLRAAASARTEATMAARAIDAEARAAALSKVVDKLAARLGPVPLRLTDENRVDDRSRTTSLRATPALMARIKRIVPMGDRNVLEALVSAAEAAQGAEPTPRKPPDGWMVFEHTEGPHRGKWGVNGHDGLHFAVADTEAEAVEWCWRTCGRSPDQHGRAPKPYTRPIGCHAAGCAAGICAACSHLDGRVYKHATGCPCADLVTVRKRGPEEAPEDGLVALVGTKHDGTLRCDWSTEHNRWQSLNAYGRPDGSCLSVNAIVWWIPLSEI